MTKKLWQASSQKIKDSNLFAFEKYLSNKFNLNFSKNYKKLLDWSIKNYPEFWSEFWDFSKIKGVKSKKKIKKSKIFHKNLFLPGTKLNFGQNLLSKNNHEKALTFISENGYREERSWKQLQLNTAKLVQFFKEIKIVKGDRIAAYMPNCNETVEAFIASSAIGGIWSSCSPDFGTNGIIERFSQITPKVLFITDQYFYNGKKINVIERLSKILKSIPSIKVVVLVSYPGKKYLKANQKLKKIKLFKWDNLMKKNPQKINFNNYSFWLALKYFLPG